MQLHQGQAEHKVARVLKESAPELRAATQSIDSVRKPETPPDLFLPQFSAQQLRAREEQALQVRAAAAALAFLLC